MVKIASFFWTIGNLCNLWHGVHNLQRIFKEHSYILELIEKDPKKKNEFKDQLAKMSSQKAVMIRSIFKSLGDLVTSSSGAGIS